ncbi:MAG: hypothetical protein L0Y44_05685 [Phycisphaerales bacterium]|nr:hypothetical protein [Phycisphaerales bacterium]MCI0630129.1 hypothetical protein [Phycisphaerales bacterium]
MNSRPGFIPVSLLLSWASCVNSSFADGCDALPIFSDPQFNGAEYRVDDLVMPTTYDVYYPQIAANNAGQVVHIWLEAIFADPASHRIHCKTSFDHGQTITAAPARVDSTPAPFGFVDPRIAMDDKGNVYAVWKRNLTFTSQTELWFSRSTNAGLNWEPDVRIDHATVPIGIVSPPQIAADQLGNVYVVWSDTRLSNKWRVFLQRSSDFGATWLADDIRVDHNQTASNRSENPQLAIGASGGGASGDGGGGGGGHVYIAWEDNRQSANSIYFNSSSDHGATFQPADIHVDSLPAGSAYLVQSPTIAASQSGDVYIAWSDLRNGNYQAWFNRSNDYGTTFAVDQRIDHGSPGIHTHPVRLAADNHDHVYGIWMRAAPGPQVNVSKLYLNSSNDGGNTWGASDTRIDNADATTHAHYAGIRADDNGRVFLAWVQEVFCSPSCVNAQDVWCATSTDFAATFAAPHRLDGAPADTNQSIPELALGNCAIAFASWRDNRHHAVVGDPLINLYTRSFAAEAPSPADINRDGSVNIFDLLAIISAWGACPNCLLIDCDADVNDDCLVDVLDLLAVIQNWG